MNEHGRMRTQENSRRIDGWLIKDLEVIKPLFLKGGKRLGNQAPRRGPPKEKLTVNLLRRRTRDAMIDLAEHSSNCYTEKKGAREMIRMIELNSRHLKQLRTVKGCSHDDNRSAVPA